MTLTPAAEARIDERIRRLAPRRGGAPARRELRSHVADAAEGLAAGAAATPAHVDAAFAALGSDDDVRRTFFPAPARQALGRPVLVALVLATALAATAIVAEDGGRATCSVSAGGSCEASASGDALELLVWAAPPLLVLALLALAPTWTGLAAAVLYAGFAALRTISDATVADLGWTALLALAGGLTLAFTARHMLIGRRLATA